MQTIIIFPNDARFSVLIREEGPSDRCECILSMDSHS